MPSLERPCATQRPPVPAPMIITLRGLPISPPSRQAVKSRWTEAQQSAASPKDNVGTRCRFCVLRDSAERLARYADFFRSPLRRNLGLGATLEKYSRR